MTMDMRIWAISLGLLATVAWTPPLLAIPSSPTNLTAIVSGSTVTLTWSAPIGDGISGYRLEAGTAPGSSNNGSSVIGAAATSLTATAVPAGIYYVRVRAIGLEGESTPSNEIVVTVASSGGCATPPNAPLALTVSGVGPFVTL